MLDLRWMNGEAFVHIWGLSHHSSTEIPDLFQYVGEVAHGPYGLLHLRDDGRAGFKPLRKRVLLAY
ncbi:Imm7 family immunity protein [Streptomyces sp. NPDC054958]